MTDNESNYKPDITEDKSGSEYDNSLVKITFIRTGIKGLVGAIGPREGVLSETWINTYDITHNKGPDRLDTGPNNKGKNTSSSENTSSSTPISRHMDLECHGG